MRDQILIVLISAGCALAVSLCGLLALRLQAGRAMGVKLFTVIMATLLGVAAGALGTAQAMFLTHHDCGVVLVVCVAVAVCAAGLGIPLAKSVTADSKALGDALRSLGNDVPGPAGSSDSEEKADRDATTVVASTLVTASGAAVHSGATASTAATAPTGAGGALATAELEELRQVLAGTSARLAESRKRERALARSRRELVAWVSHDLRAPLAGLLAMAEALEDGKAADPEQYHTRIRISAERLSAMVDDLVEMSRIHAGALRLSLAGVPLADLVGHAVLGASALAQDRGVALSSDALTPIEVRVDPRELSRALDELLATAITHTPRRGSVRIEAMERDGSAVLVVTDTCGGTVERDACGAPGPAGVERSPLTREPLTVGRRGLTFVRGIVEAHSGEIDVRDAVGGCHVEVRLPLSADARGHAHVTADQAGHIDRPRAGTPVVPEIPGPIDRSDQDVRTGRASVTLLRRRRTP